MNIFLLLFYSLIAYIVYSFFEKNRKFSNQDPKGPMGLPIVGHLHLLGDKPHRSLLKMMKYGPIFRIWMGDHYTMIVNDPSLIREIWVKKFDNFINRPHPSSFGIYSGNFQDLAFSDSEIWRKSRGMVSAAFTKTKLKNIIKHLDDQTSLLLEAMKPYQTEKKPFYCKKYFSRFALNVIFKVLFSEEIPYEEGLNSGKMERLTDPIHMVFKKLGAGSIDDYVSLFSPFFYFSRKHFRSECTKIKEFMKEIYDEHVQTIDKKKPRDLLDQMIIESKGEAEDNIIHVGMDFMLAGSDSSAGTIEWFCLYMTNNQEIQIKAYNELQNAIGKGNIVESKHRTSTPYLNAIIKEVMRLRPIGPLGIPRQAKEDCMIDGYFVPRGTQVNQNIYGLSNDPSFWSNPEQFQPERFLVEEQRSLYSIWFRKSKLYRSKYGHGNSIYCMCKYPNEISFEIIRQ